ncbi:hypothetical protein AAVH_38417, partial [Aphelenchoides avenae]
MGPPETGGDVEVGLRDDSEDEYVPDFKEHLSSETFETISRRLNHCFIQCAFINFSERAFLEYWLPRTTSRVESIEIDFAPNADNMHMVDLAVNHLRPTSIDAEANATTWNSDGSVHSSDCLTLLDRESFRTTTQTCKLG